MSGKNKISFAKATSKNLSASCLLYKVDAIIRVEDSADIEFWQDLISYARQGKRVKFLPCSIDENNKRHTGKKQCLKYINELDFRYMIAVDSDLDYLLDNPKLKKSKFILQTYTYSWENHYCNKISLEAEWLKYYSCGFSFENFIDNLNNMLFMPLTILLWNKKNKNKSITLNKFDSLILKNQPSIAKLANNGSNLLNDIQNSLMSNSVLSTTPADPRFNSFVTTLKAKGMQADSVYFYMQGHCLYDLIIRIGNVLCNNTISFEYQILKMALKKCGYREIDNVVADIKRVL